MWKPDVCIYHGGCDDGFGAAWTVWRKWRDIEFVFGAYGKDLDVAALSGKNVLFVDFSLKRDRMYALAQVAKSVVVIDHHKTAQAELAEFPQFIRSQEALGHSMRIAAENGGENVHVWFDMKQSGATMAWQFAHGIDRAEESCPAFLAYIEDRDLWRFSFGDNTRQFSAALRSYEQDFGMWTAFAEIPSKLIDEGAIILRAHMKNVREFAKAACMDVIGGHTVPVANVPYHYASDVAHELLQMHPDAPFAASYYRRNDGRFSASLRSEDSREDVSEIAKKFGGGGHRNAAGFESVTMSNP